MLADVISNPGDQNAWLDTCQINMQASERLVEWMANYKNSLVFWTDLKHLTKQFLYHVRRALH